MIALESTPAPFETAAPSAFDWRYETAFCRHRGLISPAEQERLRESRVAIVGMGGVGGVHLMTLARLGIGKFHIADPDRFETANFNRQFGAAVKNLGRPKVEVLAEEATGVNPELELRIFDEAIDESNVGEFLEGVDLVLDGIDFFAIRARRCVFREAAKRGIWAITAGPIGFGTAWLSFDPEGMSFDRYFDLHDGQDRLEQLIAFAVGLAPRGTHLAYMDLSQVDIRSATGPSAALACHLASGVAAAESLKVLLGRGKLRPAPCYSQFDAYRGLLRTSYLHLGNRNPWQRLKRAWLRRRFAAAPASGGES